MKKIISFIFLILCFFSPNSLAFEAEEENEIQENEYINFEQWKQEEEEETPFSLYVEKNEPLHGKIINTRLPDLNEVSAYSRAINLPLGDMVIGISAFSTNPHRVEYDNVRFLGKYRYKKIRLNTQLAQLRTDKVNNRLSNTLLLSPELDLTKSLSLKTDFATDFRTKENKGGLAINYHPYSSQRNLEFEFGVMNTYKQNAVEPQQKFRFLTKFKI